jgi:hypothetical protein
MFSSRWTCSVTSEVGQPSRHDCVGSGGSILGEQFFEVG